jgi:hypothetical protein
MGSSATPFLLAARPLLFLYGDSITQLGSKVFQFFSFRPCTNLACAQAQIHETCEQNRITCIICVYFYAALDDVI